MLELNDRIAKLPPEKRALLTLRLKKKADCSASKHTLRKREDLSTYPLSFAQERLWFLHQLEPESPVYNIAAALQLEGKLDSEAWRKSINEIVSRHEVLRARFVLQEGHPVQIVSPELELDVPMVDLESFKREEQEAAFFRIAASEARTPFDLVHGPLIRTKLLRLDSMKHVALVAVHHIVSDGWSSVVFVRELAEFYNAFCRNRPAAVPILRFQYSDYAEWQRSLLQGDLLASQLEYWKKVLGSSSGVLDLPTDRPRPQVKTYKGAHYAYNLPLRLAEELRRLGKAEGATLFMVLLAAFKMLLRTYSSQEDVNIGVPLANRNSIDTESLIGFFVNTLVFRTDLSGNPTFRQLLRRVRERTLEGYAHQDLPFDKLVSALFPQRNLGQSPLFQVMLDFQQSMTDSFQVGDLKIHPLEIDSGTSKFDLMLMAAEHAAGLKATFEYNTELFDSITIIRMADQFQRLLEQIVADPDRPISDISTLPPAEKWLLVSEWNDTASLPPEEMCIHRRFEEQAALTPRTTAVFCEGEELAYDELNRRANQLARRLQKMGVGSETLVGLCMERSIGMIIGILGILKAGGAYIPLDPFYPPERLQVIMEDSLAPVLLTQKRILPGLPANGAKVVLLDEYRALINLEETENLETESAPENLAYVIYTSGSTGRPKGVMIQHRSAVHLAASLHRLIYSRQEAPLRIGLNASLSFDASVQQLLMLLYGHTLFIIPQEIRGNGKALLDYIRRHRLNALDCVPSQLKILLKEGLLEGPDWIPSMMLPGGEAIDEETWRALAETPRCDFYNMYGPTECTVDSTVARVRTAGDQPVIGRPVCNATHFALDAQLQPVPINVPGELHIGGEAVGRGYFNRPNLTAEKFIPDPFSDQPGARLYKTGDLVRWRPDGNLEFLGRIDHQVKIRGFRIELEEIEAALHQHPDVEQAAVAACEDKSGQKYLAAYIVGGKNEASSVSVLRRFLKNRLPGHMIPSAFVRLDSLPRTPNGKLDRRALPRPERLRPELEKPYVVPRTPLEKLLVGKWQEILEIDKVGVYDNFFELGGDSLKAAVLVNRLREVLSSSLQINTLFLAPAVADFVAYLEEHHFDDLSRALREIDSEWSTAGGSDVLDSRRTRADQSKELGPRLNPLPRTENLPLSFAQQRLWFLDQLTPESALYNISTAARLIGDLNLKALQDSFNEIMRRHEILRATFPSVDGKARVQIAEHQAAAISLIDLSHLPQKIQDFRLSHLMETEANTPFSLSSGPLWRLTLFRLAERNHVLMTTMHHIITDAWSTNVLTRELAALYGAIHVGAPSPLKDLPIQYVDFARWQRELLQGDYLDSQLDFWKKRLEGIPRLLELPTDRPRPSSYSIRGATRGFTFDENLFAKLKDLSRKEGTTLFMSLLAVFQALLYRYTGQKDICVGTPIANRSRRELENLIGFFVNTLVMRANFSGDPSFRELLQRVSEYAAEAYAHQDIPFDMVVDEVESRRDLSHNPLFQVMFTFQEARLKSMKLPGLTLTPLEVNRGAATFDLTLSMLEEEGGLSGYVEYNTDLFGESTIERMVGHYEKLLEGVAADPNQSIASLPLLTEREREKVLRVWNDTKIETPSDRCVHELFESRAEQRPDAPAVFFEDRVLSYGELNCRANQLANHLMKRGVGPESLVGISTERSPEMIVGILGILKAGGAYLPLDAAYPPERLAFMLEDSRVKVLLTQSRLLERLPPAPCERLCLDADWDKIKEEAVGNVYSGVTPDNLAYVIYTSGSTGRPKGTMLSHRGLSNLTAAQREAFGIGEGSRILQFSPFSFDASVWETFMALANGGALCLARQEVIASGLELAGLIGEKGVTNVTLPPSFARVLPVEALTSLRTVIVAGEKCAAELVDRWAEGRQFFNAYGPTETTVCASMRPCLKDEEGDPPIGRPIANGELYVLDGNFQPVPAGVPGELCVGGVSLARGYLRRPELTAEKFIPHPFGEKPGGRLYRTGDLARALPDGEMEFLGRIDNQVKVRGFRIELGEVETALRQMEGVREGVVVPQGERLAAYVVARGESAPTAGALRSGMRRNLPDYMVPSVFIFLHELPLTPNGKVDRKALPAPDQVRPELEVAYVPPKTLKEKVIAEIWSQVLGLESVGIHDNFFELGGDSILSIQVVARAAQAGLKLTPRQLFKHPTVAELAEAAGEGPGIQAEQGTVEGPVTLTPIQRWFFEQGFPEPHHFNQSVLLEVNEELSPTLLKRAVGHLLTHHDALRLRFRRTDAGWEAMNAGVSEEAPFEWVDLSGLKEIEQGADIEAHSADLQVGLDLTSGPLIRVAYFHLGKNRPDRLVMIAHHLVIDVVSWQVLVDDLWSAYTQLKKGEPPRLPPKTTSFKAWAERLAKYAQTEDVLKELPFWLNTASRRFSSLPVDFPTGSNEEADIASIVVQLTTEETDSLKSFKKAYGVEVEEVLLTALTLAVSKWTKSRELLIDLEGHGRENIFEDVDLSRTVGWFTALCPLPLDLGRTDGPIGALPAVKEQLRSLQRKKLVHGLISYLSDLPQPEATALRKMRAEIVFNYLGQVDHMLDKESPFRIARGSSGRPRSLRWKRSHLIEIDGGIFQGRLQSKWDYSRGLFRQETMERLTGDFTNMLREMIGTRRSPSLELYTPSDFPDVDLEQKDIMAIMTEIGEGEATIQRRST